MDMGPCAQGKYRMGVVERRRGRKGRGLMTGGWQGCWPAVPQADTRSTRHF